MKNPICFIKLLLCTAGLLCLLLSSRAAYAQANSHLIPIIGLDVGWEDMLAGGHDYKTNNHGLMFTLELGLDSTGGSSLFGMDTAGFQIEQDLGFIDLRHKEKKWADARNFKGATLAGVNGHFILHSNPTISFSPKLGIGSVYMKAPEGSDKSIQAWFAIRPSIAVNFMIVCVMAGLELDYTLGLSEPNAFDGSQTTHFISLKFKIWV